MNSADNESAPLPKQPDPSPSFTLDEQAPSIWIYFVLFFSAVFLIIVAFQIQKPDPDWAGFWLNLATEIIGAIVILIVVDKRLRDSELKAIYQYAESTSSRLTLLFPSNARDTVIYIKALEIELNRIRSKVYFERAELESLFEKHPAGFILYGHAGSGKSTLLQSIALKQTRKVVEKPQDEKIPILIPVRFLENEEIFEQIWKIARKYSNLKQKRLKQWLENGKLLVIIDGLDETPQIERALEKIKDFKSQYPNTSLIASVRSYKLPEVSKFINLPTEEIKDLSKEEIESFISMYQKKK